MMFPFGYYTRGKLSLPAFQMGCNNLKDRNRLIQQHKPTIEITYGLRHLPPACGITASDSVLELNTRNAVQDCGSARPVCGFRG
jgi:hypothetical protein